MHDSSETATVVLRYGASGATLNVLPPAHASPGTLSGHGRGGPFATFLRKDVSADTFTLEAHDGQLVRVAACGGAQLPSVDARGSPGDPATLLRAAAARGGGKGEVLLCPASDASIFLSVGPLPALALECVRGPSSATAFVFAASRHSMSAARALAASPAPRAAPAPALLASVPRAPPFELSPSQLDSFARCGFLIIPRAADALAVRLALRHCNATIGAALAGVPAAVAPAAASPAAPLLSDHPAVVGCLVATRALAAATALVPDAKPVKLAQLAPRWPEPLEPAAAVRALAASRGAGGADDAPERARGAVAPCEVRSQGAPSRWHIDGMDKGVLAPFSLLVGIALSDTTDPAAGDGQFTVFPGSHIELARFVTAHGEAALVGVAGSGVLPPRPLLSAAPLELRLAAGDAVLAHPLLAHRIGINYAPHVRYAMFYRVKSERLDEHRARLLCGDAFAGLSVPPAIAAAAAAAAVQ